MTKIWLGPLPTARPGSFSDLMTFTSGQSSGTRLVAHSIEKGDCLGILVMDEACRT